MHVYRDHDKALPYPVGAGINLGAGLTTLSPEYSN